MLSGRFHLDLPDETMTLDPFDVYTVPRGVTNGPRAEDGTRILMVEPRARQMTARPTARRRQEVRLH